MNIYDQLFIALFEGLAFVVEAIVLVIRALVSGPRKGKGV